jgi:hypothetical protein
MFTFERGSTNTILLGVLKVLGTIPTYPGDYSTPQVHISHVNGGAEVEDVAFINMTQLSGSNRWFYKYVIPITAPFTKYLVTFKATMDGIVTESFEEFRVAPPIGFTAGTGEFPIELVVKNAVTHAPIVDALIRIFDKANPTNIMAMMNTDSNGSATVYLDQGEYIAEFSKTGEISETHNLVVNADGTYYVIGD